MKKLIMVVAVLMCASAAAQDKSAKPVTYGTKAIRTTSDATVYVRPFCMFGQQFLATTVGKASNVNGAGEVQVTQVLRASNSGTSPPQPMACQEDGN